MNVALILAAGVGQRMRNAGLPKQFLKLAGKPIIIYTLEKFEECTEIDKIIVVCHGSYMETMMNFLKMYEINKVEKIIIGGSDRQQSLKKGLEFIENIASDNDIVVIHDGVRPMVSISTINENIRVAKEYNAAITVHPVTESVVVTREDRAGINDFEKRDNTYSMTSPQSFQLASLLKAYEKANDFNGDDDTPLLDAAMVYANSGGKVYLVKEQRSNIKITTPEDFYFLKAMIDLEESKYIFGL